MMTAKTALVPVLALAESWATMARERAAAGGRAPSPFLKVLLDCVPRFEGLLRSALHTVDFVGSEEAEVCIRVTQINSRRGRRRCRVAFIGMGPFEGIEAMALLSGLPRRSPKEPWLEQGLAGSAHASPQSL